MADKWDKYADTDDKWSQYEDTEPTQVATEPSSTDSSGLEMAGLAAGGAGALYGANRFISKPARDVQGIEKAFNAFRSQIPVDTGKLSTGSASDLIGIELGAKQRAMEFAGKQPLTGVAAQGGMDKYKVGADAIKTKLSDLNRGILSSNVDDITTHITNNAPQFFKDTYNAYGKGLAEAENILASGKGLSWSEFQNDLFKGVDDEIVDSLFGKAGTGELNISKAKSIIKSVMENPSIPQAQQHKILSRYGQFLEKNLPDESKAILKSINSDYKTVVKLRDSLGSMKGGEFNTNKLYGTIRSYAEDNVKKSEESVAKLLKSLSEGSNLSKPMEGLAGKTASLEGVKTQRQALVKAGERVNTNTVNATANANKIKATRKANLLKLQEELNSLAMWKDKVDDLVVRKDAIIKAHPWRLKGMQGIAKTAGGAILRKIATGGMLAMGGMAVADALGITSDVQAAEAPTITDPMEAFLMAQQRVKLGSYPEIRRLK